MHGGPAEFIKSPKNPLFLMDMLLQIPESLRRGTGTVQILRAFGEKSGIILPDPLLAPFPEECPIGFFPEVFGGHVFTVFHQRFDVNTGIYDKVILGRINR